MSLFVACRSKLYTCDKILLTVGAQLTNRQLRSCKNDRLGKVLKHKRQGTRRVSHGVCAMKDDEAVITVIIVCNDAHKLRPPPERHVRRVDRRCELISVYVSLQVSEFWQIGNQVFKVKRLKRSCLHIAPHSYSTAGIDKQHFVDACICSVVVHHCTFLRGFIFNDLCKINIKL